MHWHKDLKVPELVIGTERRDQKDQRVRIVEGVVGPAAEEGVTEHQVGLEAKIVAERLETIAVVRSGQQDGVSR